MAARLAFCRKEAKVQRSKEAKRCLVDRSARGLLLVRAAYRTRRESTHATGESPDAAGWIAGGHSRGTERLRILDGMGKCTRLPMVFGFQNATGNGVPLPMPPESERSQAF